MPRYAVSPTKDGLSHFIIIIRWFDCYVSSQILNHKISHQPNWWFICCGVTLDSPWLSFFFLSWFSPASSFHLSFLLCSFRAILFSLYDLCICLLSLAHFHSVGLGLMEHFITLVRCSLTVLQCAVYFSFVWKLLWFCIFCSWF